MICRCPAETSSRRDCHQVSIFGWERGGRKVARVPEWRMQWAWRWTAKVRRVGRWGVVDVRRRGWEGSMVVVDVMVGVVGDRGSVAGRLDVVW